MYCPLCRAEYRIGFTECADCGVPLVDGVPDEEPPAPEDREPSSFVPVFSTYRQTDIMLVKAYVDAEGIPYYLQGELYSGSGIYVTPVTLFVAETEAERVREMLKDHGIE